jgi:hypothetical protein
VHKPKGVSRRLAAAALLAAALSPVAAAQPLAITLLPASSATASPATSAAQTADAPALTARFRVTWTPSGQPAQVQHWQLQRSAIEIGWIKGDGREDVWRRDSSGIRLERVLRRDRHLIDYSAGELRTLGVQTDWHALGSLFTDADLARLRRLPDPQSGAWPHYRGELDGEQVELRWDPVARLPVQLLRRSKAGQVRYERLALSVAPPADWPRAGAGTEDFQRLDAADFGDMEDNPVVRREEARDALAGWRKPQPH